MAKSKKLEEKLQDLFEAEEDEMVRMSLYLKSSVRNKVIAASEKSGKSVNQVVERILERFFEE